MDREQWVEAITSAALAAGGGKATGPDGIPMEVFRAAPAACKAVACVAHRAQTHGLPIAWRGGLVPIPKQAKQPMTRDNNHAIICADASANLVAKVLKGLAIPGLVQLAGSLQADACPGGGVVAPIISAKLHLLRPCCALA